MRRIQKLQAVSNLKRTMRRDFLLEQYLTTEIEDAISAMFEQSQVDAECLRQYNGVPRNPVRNVPVENAPNIEVTLGAIAADSLYAQAITNVFNVNPILTVMPVNGEEYVGAAKALQRYTNWGVQNEWKLRRACEHVFLDVVQLGTGIAFIPDVERKRKGLLDVTITQGPEISPLAVEDFIVPGGSNQTIEDMPWKAMRMWLTQGEINDYGDAETNDPESVWDISKFKPVGNIGFMRSRREALGRTLSNSKIKKLYEFYLVYIRFDYDRDGIDEDLLVVWDRTSKTIGWLGYTTTSRDPFESAVYQIRTHLFRGIGVLEMLQPYEEEVTEAHNDRALNVKLANMRAFKTKQGQVDEGTVMLWAGRNFQLQDPDADMKELRLSEIYPSAIANEAATISLAERRVGVNELNTPRPSQVLGSRTPAFTTSALIQQQNNRFAPAFDNMRDFASGCVRQCLLRKHERLRTVGPRGQTAQDIIEIMGKKDGQLIVDLLSKVGFERNVNVELTASSAAVNRDAEKQNALLLGNIVTSYYLKVLQLVQAVSQPGVAPIVKETGSKIAAAWGEMIERTIRTFDQIRDPHRFVIDVSDQLDALPVQQQGLAGLAELLQGGGGQGEQTLPTQGQNGIPGGAG